MTKRTKSLTRISRQLREDLWARFPLADIKRKPGKGFSYKYLRSKEKVYEFRPNSKELLPKSISTSTNIKTYHIHGATHTIVDKSYNARNLSERANLKVLKKECIFENVS